MFPALAEQVEARSTAENIARLAAAFRAAGQPVVHTHVAHRPDFADVAITNLPIALAAKNRSMTAGTEEVEPHPALVPQADDFVHLRRAG